MTELEKLTQKLVELENEFEEVLQDLEWYEGRKRDIENDITDVEEAIALEKEKSAQLSRSGRIRDSADPIQLSWL